MKTTHPICCAALAVLCASSSAAAQGHAGLWRYKDRGVWIQITVDGKAFQCRVDKDEVTTFTSEGKVSGDEIHWNKIWGNNPFAIVGGVLFIEASGRRLEFAPARVAMSSLCKSPLAAPSGL